MFKRNPETFDRFMNPLSRASGSLDWMHFSKDRLTNFTLKSIIGIVMNRDIFDFSVRYEMVESRTTLPLFTEFFLTIKAEGELISFGGSEISATRSKIIDCIKWQKV
ncbi:Phosphoribosylamine--glycine ligase [Trichinella pseudospiralis]